jgi:CRP/FNR family cyclic AMP-dependent transcriptional regulator
VKGLRGLAFIFGCFKTSEYGSWIAVTIYANHRGGVREAGAVLVASLVPATLAALGTGNLLVKFHARTVLAWGMVVQATGLAAMALFSWRAAPVLATYAAAVVAATAMVTSRPAISALLPALTPDARSITRAHVLLGWLDGAATLVGPATTAVCLLIADFPVAFLAFATIAGLASVMAFWLPLGGEVDPLEDDSPLKLGGALRQIAKAQGPRSALLLLTAQGLLIGCLDLLVVAIPDRMHGSLASAGWYGTALGGGAILGGTASVVLIGRRRLWPAAVASTVVAAGTVAALCATRSSVAVGEVFVTIGAAASMMLVAGRATLQRLTELRLVSHVFAAAEALESAMLLAGAVLVPALVSAAGINSTCLAIAGILLASAVVVLRPIVAAERAALGAFERVAALREVSALAHLGAAMLESLGRAAQPHTFAAGSALMTQGETGDVYQVIVNGHVDISRNGSVINHLGPGSGVGELALLFPTPRTATVTATDEVNTLSLDRDTFLLALTQQPPPTSVYALIQSRMTKPEPSLAAT